ncbi:MAG: hypothetical protein AVDCRST_MAG77-1967, partial [uncultured Chloroflexi bacterium]
EAPATRRYVGRRRRDLCRGRTASARAARGRHRDRPLLRVPGRRRPQLGPPQRPL